MTDEVEYENSLPSRQDETIDNDDEAILKIQVLNELSFKSKTSVVEYFGLVGSGICGYCKDRASPPETGGGRKCYEMDALSLTASQYQILLGRSWRRCGVFCYQPTNYDTCCPNYPISCLATSFQLSRSQRRCIENLNAFLMDGTDPTMRLNYNFDQDSLQNDLKPGDKSKTIEQLRESHKARDRRFVKSIERISHKHSIPIESAIRMIREKNHKRQFKLASLDNYLYPLVQALPKGAKPPKLKHKLEIKLHHVSSKAALSLIHEEHELMKVYQDKIHNDSLEKWTLSRYLEFLVRSPIRIEPMIDRDYIGQCDSDTLTSSIDTDKESYLLVKPPELPGYYGTYHCVYLLDGKLIAVGVLDVLPACITTNYLFYDPNYAKLNVGVYSALVEISLVRRISARYISNTEPDRLIYYNLGLYVHECEKMHYKTKFRPSFLICSETLKSVPTEICLLKLKDTKYARFCDDPEINYNIRTSQASEDEVMSVPVDSPVSSSNKMYDYLCWVYAHLGTEYVDIAANYIARYVTLVGPLLAPNLIVRLQYFHRLLSARYGSRDFSI